MHHFKLSAYNSNVQRIRKKIKKNLKNMHHFKLSAYNKVQATRKTDKSIQYIVVTEVTWWTIYSKDYMF